MSKNKYDIGNEDGIERASEGVTIDESVEVEGDDLDLTAETGINVFEATAYAEASADYQSTTDDGKGAIEVGAYAGASAGGDTEAYVGLEGGYTRVDEDGDLLRVKGVVEARSNGEVTALAGVDKSHLNADAGAGEVKTWTVGASGGIKGGDLGAYVRGDIEMNVYKSQGGMASVFANSAAGVDKDGVGASLRVGAAYEFDEPIDMPIVPVDLARVEAGVQYNSDKDSLISTRDSGVGSGFEGEGVRVGFTAKFTL